MILVQGETDPKWMQFGKNCFFQSTDYSFPDVSLNNVADFYALVLYHEQTSDSIINEVSAFQAISGKRSCSSLAKTAKFVEFRGHFPGAATHRRNNLGGCGEKRPIVAPKLQGKTSKVQNVTHNEHVQCLMQ